MKQLQTILITVALLFVGMPIFAQGVKIVKKGGLTIDYNYSKIERIEVKFDPARADTAVDLGLPSGLKWAKFNVGANAPEEHGGYYAWGETEEKNVYSWGWYLCKQDQCGTSADPFIKSKTAGWYTLGAANDVAHMKWGGSWRMPTEDDLKELTENCTREKATINGVTGYKFTGWNGNSIFLPDGQIKNGPNLTSSTYTYWTSSNSHYDASTCQRATAFASNGNSSGFSSAINRAYGLAVRPVNDATTGSNIDGYNVYRTNGKVDIYTFQEVDHIEAYLEKPYDPNAPTDGDDIDLGLPSGTKWTSCNLGAVNPWDFGNYYSGYDVINGITKPEGYSVPSKAEFEELIKNCEVKTVTYNNVQGNMFTSKINGNKIFLPLAGKYERRYSGTYDYYEGGYYWSGSRTKTTGYNEYFHYYLSISTNYAYVSEVIEQSGNSGDSKWDKYSVRLVR